MNRWLSSSEISLSSERKQRKLAEELVGENLDAETAPFSFTLASGGEELRVAAHIFIPNLVEKVVQMLEQNEKYNFQIMHDKYTYMWLCSPTTNSSLILREGRLTWHGGIIPEDEVWLKLGGDKGDPSK